MKINILDYVNRIIDALSSCGHSAYIVGGCVRDALLNRKCNDFDITTSATPGEIKLALSKYKTVDTGIKHGTVTAVTDKGNVEITTFRVDGEYKDNRHPESVKFTASLKEDLGRRDFTVNALAYNNNDGLVDPFGGVDDLNLGIIRTVGNAEERFREDALRILRAVRFCAQLGFSADSSTKAAMHDMRFLLNNISRERIKTELEKTLLAPYCESALENFCDIICTALGLAKKDINYRGISLLPYENDLRFAFLLCKSTQTNEIMNNLKCEKALSKSVVLLCKNIDFSPENEYELKKFISVYGLSHTKKLLALKHVLKSDDEKLFAKYLANIEKERPCLSIKELKISGNDLIDLGYKSIEIGKMLDLLLDMVMRGEIENEREKLITYAKIKH